MIPLFLRIQLRTFDFFGVYFAWMTLATANGVGDGEAKFLLALMAREDDEKR